ADPVAGWGHQRRKQSPLQHPSALPPPLHISTSLERRKECPRSINSTLHTPLGRCSSPVSSAASPARSVSSASPSSPCCWLAITPATSAGDDHAVPPALQMPGAGRGGTSVAVAGRATGYSSFLAMKSCASACVCGLTKPLPAQPSEQQDA